MKFEIEELMKVREQYLEKRGNAEKVFHQLTGAIDLISLQINQKQKEINTETANQQKLGDV